MRLIRRTFKLGPNLNVKHENAKLITCTFSWNIINRILMTSTIREMFEGKADHYNGVTVDSSRENCSNEEFPALLNESLTAWMEQKKRAIWFKVDLKRSSWVPILAENGFKFHHAKNDFVMMYRWLPTEETDNVPSYAHTSIGVGGLVINDKSELLVVREKYWTRAHWKLPGGLVDEGEHLIDAVKREVQEETNIKTEFDSMICMRHMHKRQFDLSDIYIIFGLKPLNLDIKKCDREIGDCKWMPVDEFLNDPNVLSANKFYVKKFLESREKNIKIDHDTGVLEFYKLPYCVFYVKMD